MFTPKIDIENILKIDGMVEGMKAAGNTTASRDEMVTAIQPSNTLEI